MTIKAAVLGTAASVPFIYSVLGPVPMAAATPTPAQCLFYTSQNCGNIQSGGCGSICGCCCCCTGCAIPGVGATGCSICYPSSMCPATSGSPCPANGMQGISCTTSTCSSPGSGCKQACSTGTVTLGGSCASAFPTCPT
jgi:hypothetical protein